MMLYLLCGLCFIGPTLALFFVVALFDLIFTHPAPVPVSLETELDEADMFDVEEVK